MFLFLLLLYPIILIIVLLLSLWLLLFFHVFHVRCCCYPYMHFPQINIKQQIRTVCHLKFVFHTKRKSDSEHFKIMRKGGSPPRHTHTHDRRDAELAFHSYRLCWLNSWLKCVINQGQMNHSFIIYMSMSVVNKLATRFRHQFCIHTLIWRTNNTGIVLTWPGYFIKVFISYFSTLMYLQSQNTITHSCTSGIKTICM